MAKIFVLVNPEKNMATKIAEEVLNEMLSDMKIKHGFLADRSLRRFVNYKRIFINETQYFIFDLEDYEVMIEKKFDFKFFMLI